MMLHEAVILEIYRQALNASALSSPRSLSRESNISGNDADARCSPNNSHCSVNENMLPVPQLDMTPILSRTDSTRLFPTESVAIAAYFNAAAVAAAQQTQLVVNNPLSSYVDQGAQPSTTLFLPTSSNKLNNRTASTSSAEDGADVNDKRNENSASVVPDDANSPLDLSITSCHKRQSAEEDRASTPKPTKNPRNNEYRSVTEENWIPPLNAYLAAIAVANLSPNVPTWTKKSIDTNNALEKIYKMTDIESPRNIELPALRKEEEISATSSQTESSIYNSRQSAWQSHWLNKGADNVKEVFKCVWCKKSFPTLESLTKHIKQTQHCGVNIDLNVSPTKIHNISKTSQSLHQTRQLTTATSNNVTTSKTITNANKSDINLQIKETIPLPRKLVRGQDVWLGKGAEQTREILKCMWCGQSFRSLAEMTNHMQETQHYTNIISQEQITSWKSTDSDKSTSGGSSNSNANSPAISSSLNVGVKNTSNSFSVTQNSTVNAVFTCKVCEEPFSSLKELSRHMAKNAHFRELPNQEDASCQMQRSACGRQARDKRKKSLPVRKLLELERAESDYKINCLDAALKPLRDFAASTKISCEKCGSKIETAVFVEHIRQCLGQSIHIPPKTKQVKQIESLQFDKEQKIANEKIANSKTNFNITEQTADDGEKTTSTSSVLNALEQLIEKSFDASSNQNKKLIVNQHENISLGTNILRRLGIDEKIDYTKPLMDVNPKHFLTSYKKYSMSVRSPSESSSISENCSAPMETPASDCINVNSQHTTHSQTANNASEYGDISINNNKESQIKTEFVKESCIDSRVEKLNQIYIKKEFSTNFANRGFTAGRKTTTAAGGSSPCTSERSPTRISTPSLTECKKNTFGSSLNALSTMFDNLNSIQNTGTRNELEPFTNNFTAINEKQKANPLAALQNFCDSKDNREKKNDLSSDFGPNETSEEITTNTDYVSASNWASPDSNLIIKCSLCEATFSSKRKYCYHHSKFHIMKDDPVPQLHFTLEIPVSSPKPLSLASPKSTTNSPLSNCHSEIASENSVISSSSYNHNPKSKFLKYAELAKQLSSNNT